MVHNRWISCILQSTSNRTLDQQCTVTRPGLAPIASSLAVEVFVNILHHSDGTFAHVDSADFGNSGTNELLLGILPHQIRGYLFHFSQMNIVGCSFDRCTACCPTVVKEYRERGMEFLLQAINHPTYLAYLAGLTELTKSANSFDIDWDDEDDGMTSLMKYDW
ncbi:unnamed protein product [Linum trigynum]|uniref:Uncharacterized protein n=1 Tax=Linum trigynum TaxID=586398 RepID=A0AAV2EQX1_9ROSI